MTRRDRFATAAMAAMLAQRPQPIEYESSMTHLAFLAYRMADAMEREARVQEVKHGDD
jgi:hypothetical protein